jgi:HSP20 family protein
MGRLTVPGRISAGQEPPVRVYQTRDRIMLAAPKPGLEPGNISVHITEDRVTIHGEERGPHQHDRDLLAAEWSFGPYHRMVSLPHPINGVLTNATYDNGVLVVTMPKMPPAQNGVPAQFRLEPIRATRGEHVGHVGRVIQSMTTGSTVGSGTRQFARLGLRDPTLRRRTRRTESMRSEPSHVECHTTREDQTEGVVGEREW